MKSLNNMAKVLCFGTFDSLHPGHDDYFRQARELGDQLIVIVALDQTVQQVKGRLPLQTEQERLRAVQSHPLVSEARLGHVGDKYLVLEEVRPDLVLLGYDQQAFTDRLEEELVRRGIKAHIERANAFHPEAYKSSLIREKMMQNLD